MDSKLASRKLGYGFSSQYQEIPLSDFVVNAKKELETVPKFNPWRLISVERKKKKLFRDHQKILHFSNRKRKTLLLWKKLSKKRKVYRKDH